MEILLTQTVDKLGEPGDIVKVAPGYARNFLLPKGLAVEPTPHNIERFKSVREQRRRERQERAQRARELEEAMDGAVLTFVRKVNPEGKLYSSVRPAEIAELLSEKFGADIEKGRIEFHEHIETPGRYHATVNLYMDITAAIQIDVIEESTAETEAPAVEGAEQATSAE